MKTYYREGLTEEDVYRAATAGMLEHIEPKMRKWNKLLSPAEVAELHSDLQSEVTGIGIEEDFDPQTGYTDVARVLANSPAEKAGMLAGDKIISINGKLFKGQTPRDVVAEIRGKVGEPVSVTLLRGDKVLTIVIKREVVVFPPVAQLALEGGVSFVHVGSFTSKTVPMLRGVLDDAGKKGARAVILDLRGNQGGSFEDAVHSAELFLPVGTEIVSLRKRGQDAEKFVTGKGGGITTLPLAVLVDHATASGAELVAAALQEGRHAQVIGERTFGKWSVQKLDDLSNGYAMKYTMGLFYTASGRSFQGVGLAPDVEVDMDPKELDKLTLITDGVKRVAEDVQLRTAVALLEVHLSP